MSDQNQPPQPPRPPLPPQGGQNLPPVPPAPGAEQPTQAYPTQQYGQSQPPAPQFGQQQTQSFGQPTQFGGQNQQFGDTSNAGGFGGNGLPPYGQQPSDQGNGNKNLKWYLIGGAAVVAIAGVVIAGLTTGWFGAAGNNSADGKDDKTTSNSDSDKKTDVKADSAKGAIESWAQALADGDMKAFNQLSSSKVKGALVSEDVVKASLKLKPIEDIEVELDKDSSDYWSNGTVTYNIDGESVSFDVSATKSGKNYEVSAFWFASGPMVADTIPITVNGVEVEKVSATDDVLPIYYEFESGSKWLALTGSTSGIGTVDDFWDIDFEVTPEAATAATEAVKEQVTACLAEKTLVSTCGFTLDAKTSAGEVLQDGTVSRTLDSSGQADLDSMEFRPDWDNPLILVGESVYPDYTVTCTDTSGATGTCDIWFAPSRTPYVDFTADEPKVTWEEY